MPTKAGEIPSVSELVHSVLKVPTINWASYISVKNVQYIKCPKNSNSWAKQLELWKHSQRDWGGICDRSSVTNDGNHQWSEAPQISFEDYSQYERMLSTRYRLVFFEEKKIVSSNLRTNIVTLLHKGPPPSTKWHWRRNTSGSQNWQKPFKENVTAAYHVNFKS